MVILNRRCVIEKNEPLAKTLPIPVVGKRKKTMDTLKINGMSCQHCVGAVKKALEKFPGLSQVSVNLEAGKATFINNGEDRQQLRAAISKIGFEPGD